MQVYVIPQDKLAIWVSDSFNPIEDANGNHIVAVNADYIMFEFEKELMQCEQITYQPKPFNF